VAAGLVCGVLALFVGIPSLRLRGIYLALGTIAFVEILRILFLNLAITGGAMGINPTYYKVLAFVIGAVLAGVVGAMSAPFLNTWNARQGTFDASVSYLAYVLIGGSR